MSKAAAAAAPAGAPDPLVREAGLVASLARSAGTLEDMSAALAAVAGENAQLRADRASDEERTVTSLAAMTQAETASRVAAERATVRAEAAEALVAAFPHEMGAAVTAARLELSAEVDKLKRALAAKQLDLEKLEDWRTERGEAKERIAALEAALAADKDAHARSTSLLERRNGADREALRVLLLNQMRDFKRSLLERTAGNLDDAMKRMIAEHEQLLEELAYSSKRVEELVADNEKLMQRNTAISRDLTSAKEELKETYARSGRLRAALAKAQSALENAKRSVGKAGDEEGDPYAAPGLGLELEELERERRGDESSISLGVGEALPRRTPVQPAAPYSAAKSEGGGALSAVSTSGHRKAVQWVGVSPGGSGGGGAPLSLLSPPPRRAGSGGGGGGGGGGGSPSAAATAASAAAADAAIDALVFMEEQRAAAEDVGDTLVAFLLQTAWELRDELRAAVGGGGEAGGVARALLLQAGGEGVDAVLDALPDSLPGGWGALRRGEGGDAGAVAAFAGAAARALAGGSEAAGGAPPPQRLPTLLALLRRLRAHLVATAVALGPEGAFSVEQHLDGEGSANARVAAGALAKGEAGAGADAQARLPIARADYVAALLRREAGGGQGNPYFVAPPGARSPPASRRAPLPLGAAASPLRKLQQPAASPGAKSAATAAAAQLMGSA